MSTNVRSTLLFALLGRKTICWRNWQPENHFVVELFQLISTTLSESCIAFLPYRCHSHTAAFSAFFLSLCLSLTFNERKKKKGSTTWKWKYQQINKFSTWIDCENVRLALSAGELLFITRRHTFTDADTHSHTAERFSQALQHLTLHLNNFYIFYIHGKKKVCLLSFNWKVCACGHIYLLAIIRWSTNGSGNTRIKQVQWKSALNQSWFIGVGVFLFVYFLEKYNYEQREHHFQQVRIAL